MPLPPRITRRATDTGRDQRDRCPGHRDFVRGHACCVPDCAGRPIEVAHIRVGTDGGMGLKPSDNWTISLCADHHAEQHRIGEPEFERAHGIVMKTLAREFASASPAWGRYLKRKGRD